MLWKTPLNAVENHNKCKNHSMVHFHSIVVFTQLETVKNHSMCGNFPQHPLRRDAVENHQKGKNHSIPMLWFLPFCKKTTAWDAVVFTIL